METYHKINSVFKREMKKGGQLLEGQYSIPEFEYLANNEWTFTEKVDGTNIRVMWDANGVRYGGKSDNAQLPAPLVERLRNLFDDEAKWRQFEWGECSVCLYGEGYGPKIQSGGKYGPAQDFVLFDVKINQTWLQRGDVEDIGLKLGIGVVPVVGGGTIAECIDVVRSGLKSQWGDFIAEGIVARPKVEMFTRHGDRVITKIKYRDFHETNH